MSTEKKLTAMQELIFEIEQQQQRFIDLSKTDKKMKKGVDAILIATTILKIKAKKLLEKEKQNIIDVCVEFGMNNETTNKERGEQYYRETFKN